MPATWTTPKTWNTGDPLTASDMNTQIRDNLTVLKAPPTTLFRADQMSDYSTSSTTFVDVDGAGTELELSITTTGGDVLIGFVGSVSVPGQAINIYFDIYYDSVGRIGQDDGLMVISQYYSGTVTKAPVSLICLKTGLSAGTHTFKPQWKVASGTATLFAGAGTSGLDVHPIFWVREVS